MIKKLIDKLFIWWTMAVGIMYYIKKNWTRRKGLAKYASMQQTTVQTLNRM